MANRIYHCHLNIGTTITIIFELPKYLSVLEYIDQEHGVEAENGATTYVDYDSIN